MTMKLGKLLSLSGAFAVFSTTFPAMAVPAQIFTPYLQEIKENLPPGYAIRLPEDIRLREIASPDLFNKLIVRVFPTNTPRGMTVGLFTCKTSNLPCLVGTFSVDSEKSYSGLREFYKIKAEGEEVSLSPTVKGYFMKGSNNKPKIPFSTLTWRQDGMIHSLTFPTTERENIIWMGSSMVNQRSPIRSPRRRVSSIQVG